MLKIHVCSHSLVPLLAFLFGLVFLRAGFAQGAAPALELQDITGKLQKLEDYRGKVVVLNFWATWCVPCKEEMPVIVEAHGQWASRNVVVLAASMDTKETQVNIPKFVEQYKIDFPVLIGGSAENLGEFDLGEAIPDTVFIDTDGTVAFRILGQARKNEVLETIEWMLGQWRGEVVQHRDVSLRSAPLVGPLPFTRGS